MKSLFTILTVCFLAISTISAQNMGVGTNNPHPSAKLHVEDANRGFLPPVMTSNQRMAISNPAEGLMVYDSDIKCNCVYTSDNRWKPMCNQLITKNLNNNVQFGQNQNGVLLTQNFTIPQGTRAIVKVSATAVAKYQPGSPAPFNAGFDQSQVGAINCFYNVLVDGNVYGQSERELNTSTTVVNNTYQAWDAVGTYVSHGVVELNPGSHTVTSQFFTQNSYGRFNNVTVFHGSGTRKLTKLIIEVIYI